MVLIAALSLWGIKLLMFHTSVCTENCIKTLSFATVAGPYNYTNATSGHHHKSELSRRRVTSVFFMKTHKTASSAVQNILLRQALISDLSIPIGKYDWARLCYPHLYSHLCPQNTKAIPFDMIVQHLRYNPTEIQASIKPNAVYVTILRHPDTLIPSAYKYFNWNSEFSSIDLLAKAYPSLSHSMRRGVGVPYRNLMLYDFGLQTAEFDNDDLVNNLINHIEKTFHVVMFQEYFSESLVLLRHALSWSLEDVVVFSVNKQSRDVQVNNSEAMDAIKEWNKQDIKLYDRLYERFNKMIEDFGVDLMAKEVVQLRALTNQVYKKCIKYTTKAKNKFGEMIKFVLTPEGQKDRLCKYLTSSELDLLEQLKNRMLHK